MTQTLNPGNPFAHVGLPALGGRRLCGPGRTAGSLYAECGLSLAGQPIEQFLLDPPTPIDPDQLGLTAQGVTVFTDEHGVKHVIDWVGSSHYKNVACFLEEARVMGVSRKIPVTTQLDGLTPDSKLFLVHAHASLDNIADLGPTSAARCPNGRHRPGEPCCAQHWITPEVTLAPDTRVTATATYTVFPPAPGAPAPRYSHAIFAVFPITALTIIRDHDGSVNARARQAASKASTPTHVANS